MAAPTRLNLTAPLPHPPAKGKTYVWLQCRLAQCTTIGQGIEEAAQAVGWKVKTITYDDADPGTLLSAMREALQYHPVGVGLTGLPEAVWESELPAYKKAGVPITVGSVGPATTDSTVLANIQGPPDMQLQAKILADWFIATSGGKGNALLLNVPGFPILNLFSEDFKQQVESRCAGCHISVLSASVAQAEANSLSSTIATQLRRDPSAHYVIACDSAFVAGLPAALSQAGLSNIKVAGMWGVAATEALVKSGQFDAVTSQAAQLLGALMLDPVMRASEGMKIPEASQYVLPVRLFVKGNLGTPSNASNYPSDWLQQLKKLWKVS